MDSTHGAAVTAEDFGLKGPRGWAFRGMNVDAGPGSLIAVEGPSGSGRTCLLLALTGRMKPTEGHAEVAGMRLPRKMAAVRRVSALGPVPGVSDLDPSFTVDEHLRERALLQRRFDGSLRALLRPGGERAAASARSRVEEALETAGLDLDSLPKAGRTTVRDLERLEALRLSVALALIGRPRLLALDDTDLKLSDADRAQAWALLRAVAEQGTTVLAVCSEAPEDAVLVSTAPSATTDTVAGKEAAPEPEADAEPEPKAQPEPTPEPDAEPDADAGAKPEPEPKAQPEPTPEPDAEPDADADADAKPEPEPDKTTTEEEPADAIAETGRA
ncbi:ATP-binding cassette domain-containing protein [Streptomyces sp. NPDC001970]